MVTGQMQLEMLAFALIAKGPIPLPLISWNWASESFLGILFHSNFLFIPEAGEGREGKEELSFPQGRITPIFYWEIQLQIRKNHHPMLIEQWECGGSYAKLQAPDAIESRGEILNSHSLDMLVFQFWPGLTKRKITGGARNMKII